jgi:hypothetical protein
MRNKIELTYLTAGICNLKKLDILFERLDAENLFEA